MTKRESLEQYVIIGGCLSAFLLPLKLSLAYASIIPTMILFILINRQKMSEVLNQTPKYILLPLLSWCGLVILTAPFGLDPINTAIKGIRFVTLLILIPMFMTVAKRVTSVRLLGFLVFGQSIAAVHTSIAPLLPSYLNQVFLGAVTESGQLAITIFIALGCAFYILFSQENIRVVSRALILSLSVFLLSIFLGFYGDKLTLVPSIILGPLLFAGVTYAAITFLNAQTELSKQFYSIFCFALPTLTAALLINLKRGPWLGVSVAIIAILFIYNRKLIVPVLGVITLTTFAIPQIHTRLIQSSHDFFIAGGRNEMWKIGVELASKFPLGIGYQNSSVINKYDPSIPTVHQHFHNNALNVLVETGWLGLFILASWILGIILARKNNKVSFPDSLLLNSMIAALASWQIAGVVEYNFGDSEVLLVVFVILGAMANLTSKIEPTRVSDTDCKSHYKNLQNGHYN